MKNKAKKVSIITILSVVFVLVSLAIYNQRTQRNLNKQVEQEVARRNHLIKYFRGTKFTYQSTVNLIKTAKPIQVREKKNRQNEKSEIQLLLLPLILRSLLPLSGFVMVAYNM